MRKTIDIKHGKIIETYALVANPFTVYTYHNTYKDNGNFTFRRVFHFYPFRLFVLSIRNIFRKTN